MYACCKHKTLQTRHIDYEARFATIDENSYNFFLSLSFSIFFFHFFYIFAHVWRNDFKITHISILPIFEAAKTLFFIFLSRNGCKKHPLFSNIVLYLCWWINFEQLTRNLPNGFYGLFPTGLGFGLNEHNTTQYSTTRHHAIANAICVLMLNGRLWDYLIIACVAIWTQTRRKHFDWSFFFQLFLFLDVRCQCPFFSLHSLWQLLCGRFNHFSQLSEFVRKQFYFSLNRINPYVLKIVLSSFTSHFTSHSILFSIHYSFIFGFR